MSSGQQGAEWRLAGKMVNTIGIIENTFGVFEISFGVLHFSASKLLTRFPSADGLLPARCQSAYCALEVCLLEAKTQPYCSDVL